MEFTETAKSTLPRCEPSDGVSDENLSGSAWLEGKARIGTWAGAGVVDPLLMEAIQFVGQKRARSRREVACLRSNASQRGNDEGCGVRAWFELCAIHRFHRRQQLWRWSAEARPLRYDPVRQGQ